MKCFSILTLICSLFMIMLQFSNQLDMTNNNLIFNKFLNSIMLTNELMIFLLLKSVIFKAFQLFKTVELK